MSNLFECFANAGAVACRVLKKLCMMFELVLVENFEGVVGLNQNVNIEVDKFEDAGFERRRGVDVAVELEESAVGRPKAKDAVPTIRPEVLGAQRPGLDGADERVADLLGEKGFEDDEGIFAPCDTRGPSAAHTPVVFAGVDDNLQSPEYAFLRQGFEQSTEIFCVQERAERTLFRSVPTPSTQTSHTSPSRSGPTPAGVPVAIRSPGSSVITCEM